jgi:hypothetical protein
MVQTSEFVRRQISAMGSDVFELGLFRAASAADGSDAGMLPRAWDSETLLRSIAWLRLENMRGRNIYIRPQGEHHLSLVDDLSKSAIDRMKSEGFQPAAIVETSPQNFQAWINHGERLPKEVGTAVARALANRFEGDTNAADWRHFGRLAGFTNQKDKHRQPNGLFPFVRLIESTGVVYREAGKLVATVREQCEREQEARAKRDSALVSVPMHRGAEKSIESFRQNPLYGGDGTRVDLAYALYALSRGVSPEEVGAAIRSRDLSHKGTERRRDEYVERTVRKALALQQSQSGALIRHARSAVYSLAQYLGGVRRNRIWLRHLGIRALDGMRRRRRKPWQPANQAVKQEEHPNHIEEGKATEASGTPEPGNQEHEASHKTSIPCLLFYRITGK